MGVFLSKHNPLVPKLDFDDGIRTEPFGKNPGHKDRGIVASKTHQTDIRGNHILYVIMIPRVVRLNQKPTTPPPIEICHSWDSRQIPLVWGKPSLSSSLQAAGKAAVKGVFEPATRITSC